MAGLGGTGGFIVFYNLMVFYLVFYRVFYTLLDQSCFLVGKIVCNKAALKVPYVSNK